MRGHETVPGENPLVPYRLTADRVRRKAEGETEAERLAAENERAHRLRHVYEAIGLAVTARKDGTLVLRWSLGERSFAERHGVRGPGARKGLRARRAAVVFKRLPLRQPAAGSPPPDLIQAGTWSEFRPPLSEPSSKTAPGWV